jgi:hypothetical protein
MFLTPFPPAIRPEMIAFVRYRPELLGAFDRDASAFPSPRSWESVLRILDSLDSQSNPAIEQEVIAGAVGTSAATEFSASLRKSWELPNIGANLLNPLQEPVPDSAAAHYAIASVLARFASDTNFDRVCAHLSRLPAVFCALRLRGAALREPAVRCAPGCTEGPVERRCALAYALSEARHRSHRWS